MDDKFYIEKYLDLIEEKLDWGSSKDWTNKHFNKLADQISESSDIRISSNTLKSLFGKLKYKDDYNPQEATKNALAIFLGFQS